MQEVDAERRTQILRGQRPSTPPPPPSPIDEEKPVQERHKHHADDGAGRYKKRRRLAGEDDTDRDIRFAREDAAQAVTRTSREDQKQSASRGNDAPLLDNTGHVNLFPLEAGREPAEKNPEAERESADKKRSYEDQYTMRFSNAAGFKQSAGQKPWYSSAREVVASGDMPSKDVWGNEDPMRRERDMARMDANDPLAAMKRGVRQLKSVEQERKKWNEERSQELEDLKAAQRREPRHRRRRRPMSERSDSGDSLERFSLDGSSHARREDGHRRDSHRHHQRRRDTSRDRRRRQSHSHSSRRHRDGHTSRHESRHSRKHGSPERRSSYAK